MSGQPARKRGHAEGRTKRGALPASCEREGASESDFDLIFSQNLGGPYSLARALVDVACVVRKVRLENVLVWIAGKDDVVDVNEEQGEPLERTGRDG